MSSLTGSITGYFVNLTTFLQFDDLFVEKVDKLQI